MTNQTEITINGEKHGVLFNNMAIGEAEHRFGVQLLNFNFIKSPNEFSILIYCGIVAFAAKYQIKPISWEDYYEAQENDKITGDYEAIVKTFQESTVISKFVENVQQMVKTIAESETEKKKKATVSLKKGKLQSTEG